MKMNKSYVLILLTIFNISVAQEATIKNTHFIERQYKSFVDDIRLIKKCYVTKKSTCNEKEQKESRGALRRMGIRGGALIIVIKGLSAIYEKLSRVQKLQQYKEQEKNQKRSSLESALLIRLHRLDMKLDALASENKRFIEDCENYQKKNKLNDLDIQAWILETFNKRKERKAILANTLKNIKQAYESLPIKSDDINRYIHELDDMAANIEMQLDQLRTKYLLGRK